MKKHWKPYALHILDCITKIHHIQRKGDITKDIILYDATLRNLQTMSEATQNLPEDKIKSYPQIPWKQISGFRNILVHDYLGDIDSQTIMNVIRDHIDPLEEAIKSMVKNHE